jgi:hypothetical protein
MDTPPEAMPNPAVLVLAGCRKLDWPHEQVRAVVQQQLSGTTPLLLIHPDDKPCALGDLVADALNCSVALVPENARAAEGDSTQHPMLNLAISVAETWSEINGPTSICVLNFPGGAGENELLMQARQLAATDRIPTTVIEISL